MALYICIGLPYDFFGNQTTAHPVGGVCAAASLAIPSLHGLSSTIVKLVAGLSFTLSPFGKRLCHPRVSAAVELSPVFPFPGIHVRPELWNCPHKV